MPTTPIRWRCRRSTARVLDLVLVGGFHWSALPKIEVIRRSSDKPHFDAALPGAGNWIAIVTDHDHLENPCRVFQLGENSWLPQLASLAWERAATV